MPLQKIFPPVPSPDPDSDPGHWRRAKLLEQQRLSSGNLSDDPTESGDPVVDDNAFRPAGGG